MKKLKKVWISLAVAVFAGLMVLNIQLSLKKDNEKSDTSLVDLLEITVAHAEGEDGGSDCCEAWQEVFGLCYKKTVTTITDCIINTVAYSYLGTNGNVVGYGVLTGGAVQMQWGYSTETYSTSNISYTLEDVEFVTCPTNGNCYSCTEYNPCTSV